MIRTIHGLITGAEILILILVCFVITAIARPVRPMAQYLLNDRIAKGEAVKDEDSYVGREETVGADYEAVAAAQRTRDYYFADHSGDKKVVVMEYIIGSNLEDGQGCASLNIAQMKDATAQGDGVDFVIQAGGSERWFTKGIEDSTVGRYLISGGELTEAQRLSSKLCMSEPDNLRDFIVWTKENYPADRYMLVMWDHGGGVASGYGYDDLNERTGDSETITASEIIGAVRDAGVKFDLIGFDACLMQNIEYEVAFEPYADYYLGSEETEPGSGWHYTIGFGKLAEDPTMSTEDFGRAMMSAYDGMNRKMNDDEPLHNFTLSLVDLTLVRPVYERLEGIYSSATAEMKDDVNVFGNMSAARSKAYEFADYEQVDLVSYLTTLKKADYTERVMKDDEIDELIKMIKTCVVYRNKDSAEGIHGMAVDFPYKSLETYSQTYEQLKAIKYKSEEKFYDAFCSIIASQKLKANQEEDSFMSNFAIDYSKEDWYVKGFEDYTSATMFVDIPVKMLDNGYLAELPEKTWASIVDCKTEAYINTDDGLIYLGQEHFDAKDEQGHPLVVPSENWAHVGGHLVFYEAENPVETEEGVVYKGVVKARLNKTEDITLKIEWEPMTAENEGMLTGKVVGYTLDNDRVPFFMRKGLMQLETGDTLEFLFDYYDQQGDFVKTAPYGDKLTIIAEDAIAVTDAPLDKDLDIEYYGILTDVYQREFLTEMIKTNE